MGITDTQPSSAQPLSEEADRVRQRVETQNLLVRRQGLWRILGALGISTVLLLLALGLRRDQVIREAALDDMERVGQAFDSWVHEHAALPSSLDVVFRSGRELSTSHLGYADIDRRRIAALGQMPVVLVYDLEPRGQLFSHHGRSVLLCKRADFQAKWLTEKEFARQRSREQDLVEKLHSSPGLMNGSGKGRGQSGLPSPLLKPRVVPGR